MLKIKNILSVCVSIPSLLAYETSNYDGFYTSFSLGANHSKVKFDDRMRQFDSFCITDKTNLNPHIGCGIGYKLTLFNKIFTDLEANCGFSNLTSNLNYSCCQVKYKNNFNYGFIGRIGYFLNPNTSFFVGVGREISNTSVSFTWVDRNNFYKSRKKLARTALSTGIQVALSDSSSLRFELTKPISKKQNYTIDNGNDTFSIKENTCKFTLGICLKI